MGHNDLIVNRDHIQAPGHVLAERTQSTRATRTVQTFRLERDLHLRKVRRQRRAVFALFAGRSRLALRIRFDLLRFGLGRRDGLLDLFQRQLKLFGIQLLRGAAILKPLVAGHQFLKLEIDQLQRRDLVAQPGVRAEDFSLFRALLGEIIGKDGAHHRQALGLSAPLYFPDMGEPQGGAKCLHIIR